MADLGQYTKTFQFKLYKSKKNRKLHKLMVRAYAAARPSRSDAFRGVWDHTGLGLYPGNWDMTCRILARNGVKDIVPNMLWGGIAHYDSNVLDTSEQFDLYGDQLKKCSAAARKHGR